MLQSRYFFLRISQDELAPIVPCYCPSIEKLDLFFSQGPSCTHTHIPPPVLVKCESRSDTQFSCQRPFIKRLDLLHTFLRRSKVQNPCQLWNVCAGVIWKALWLRRASQWAARVWACALAPPQPLHVAMAICCLGSQGCLSLVRACRRLASFKRLSPS